jgi:hypothetical protein
MTGTQLDRAVAVVTGETVRTIRRLGFGLLADVADDPAPEDLCLQIDCPFCGRAVTYPGPAGDGAAAPAECLACDVSFDFAPEEVYAAAPAETREAWFDRTPPRSSRPRTGHRARSGRDGCHDRQSTCKRLYH